MKAPYPVTIVPLLPEFLQKRRAKVTYPLRVMEELGIDRPALFTAINLAYRDPAGVTNAQIRSPYSTVHEERWLPAYTAAEGAGLIEQADGRWRLTGRGRQVAYDMHRAAHEHFATLELLPDKEMSELADLLERAFQACVAAGEPETKHNTARGLRFREVGPRADASMAKLDNAVYGLWGFRDDCHQAAWRGVGIEGPRLDVLTRVWRSEAATLDELTEKIPHQRPADVAAAVAWLREEGRAEPGEPLSLTAGGRAFREAIEAETDRLFFTPWPDEVGERADWIEGRLRKVVAALA